MEEEWQKQLKLSRKLSRELSAKGVNTEVGEDDIQDEKTDVNNGGKDDEEGNGVKGHNGEDNDEDFREVPLNISADEVFFYKSDKLIQFNV